MKVCYAEQMRTIDRLASESGAIPSIVLMENAAISCVNEILKQKPKSAAVFCGRGNNGGDGFAIARHLHNNAIKTTVFLVCGDEFKGDALVNFNIIERMDIETEQIYDSSVLDFLIPSYDIIIDAIFGTGIHGQIEGLPLETIEKINKYSKYTLSVDVPSGMNSDTGEICGSCIKANMTVTFAAYKIGMFQFPAADYTGEVKLCGISIPEYILQNAPTAAEVLSDSCFAEHFPKRRSNSQKGDYGKILIVGGSRGMSGAAYMSATAALNSGAGLITLAVPNCINDILEAKTTEIMTLPLADFDGHLSQKAVSEIIGRAEKSDVILIGPGMGKSTDCEIILEELLSNSKVPVIVDADALNILSENMDILKKCTCPLILTPHEVEMSRLTGFDLEYIIHNRIGVSKEFCEKYGVTLILKGNHTIVTAPNGFQYINNTGNAGLAKGGSGDVLAGITAALTARIPDEALAAAMAVYLHGKSADAVMEQSGIEGVTASAVAAESGRTIRSICK